MSADRLAGSFGGKLRDARESRGVSLRQIANATKISVAALEALERNDISRLPGGIFSRAFVRSYANEVGLDPEATIREFIAEFPNDSVTAGHPTSGRVEDHEAVESNRQTAGTFVWLAVISVPLAAALLYFTASGCERARIASQPPRRHRRRLRRRRSPNRRRPIRRRSYRPPDRRLRPRRQWLRLCRARLRLHHRRRLTRQPIV